MNKDDLPRDQDAGASEDVARQVTGNCHRWWRNSVLTLTHFDRLGCRDCPKVKPLSRPVRTRMPGGVAGVPPTLEVLYADA